MNGIGTRTTRTETYPLPYAEFCLPVVSGKGYGGGLNYGFGIGVSSYSLTSVTIANNSEDSSYRWTGYTYIVIGAQPQWGENVGSGTQTVSLPISFEVAFTAVVSADSSWCSASCHITTTTITTMNYQSNKPDIAQLGPVQWLAIGIQPQWGYTKHRTTIFFPIAYKLECFGVTAPSGLVDLFYESGAGIGIKDITLTSAYSVGSGFWISAGQ